MQPYAARSPLKSSVTTAPQLQSSCPCPNSNGPVSIAFFLSGERGVFSGTVRHNTFDWTSSPRHHSRALIRRVKCSPPREGTYPQASCFISGETRSCHMSSHEEEGEDSQASAHVSLVARPLLDDRRRIRGKLSGIVSTLSRPPSSPCSS